MLTRSDRSAWFLRGYNGPPDLSTSRIFPALRLIRRWPTWLEWLLFLGQVALVEIFDAGNDIVRGDIFPPNPAQAIENGRQVAHFEAAHGFFVEPTLYTFFQHTHHVLGIALTPQVTVGIANNVYAFLHIGVPLLVAGWVYVRHRSRFGLLRNVLIITGLLAFVGYMVYPLAPPRLTTGLVYHHHAFVFHNTMPYPQGGLQVNGRPLGYNPYAAMPSLHIAWATIVAAALLLLSRNPLVRVFAVIYPAIMMLAIVVTANHYIMDGVGSLIAVGLAAPLALAIGWRGTRARLGEPDVRKSG